MSAPESSRLGASSSASSGRQRASSTATRPSDVIATAIPEGAPVPDDGFNNNNLLATPSVHSRMSSISRSPNRLSVAGGPSRPAEVLRQPSVRIRRNSNASSRSSRRFPPAPDAPPPSFEGFQGVGPAAHSGFSPGRARSASQPERYGVTPPEPAAMYPRIERKPLPSTPMPRLTEEGSRPTMEELGVAGSPMSPSRSMPQNPTSPRLGDDVNVDDDEDAPRRKRAGTMRRVSRMFWPGSGRKESNADDMAVWSHPPARSQLNDEYGEELVDWLDVIDPEVQTLSTLTNVQNALFVPDLGNWLNRRPTYTLSRRDYPDFVREPQQPSVYPTPAMEVLPEIPQEKDEGMGPGREDVPPMRRTDTISSRLTDSHYAALPHGTSLEGWTPEEKRELDDHVRHMLHSRRARFKRTMKGFGQYVRRPLGFLITLYATLITVFGLAWVLFLIGWIYGGSKTRQDYLIFIIDSVLVALFACFGIGLAPFRLVDTYRTIFIVRYTRKIEDAKKGKRRARLQKRNPPRDVRAAMNKVASNQAWHKSMPADLAADGTQPTPPPILGADGKIEGRDGPSPSPTSAEDQDVDLEEGQSDDDGYYIDPLTPKQRKRLEHHQKKLARSHSYYKPSETFTHYPFPLKYLIAIIILVDCHSCLQISLSSCTWGISYHTRPFALTTVILCVSITCNITAGILITIGDRKVRKPEVWKLLDRQELTGDAIKELDKEREKKRVDSNEDSGSSRMANLVKSAS